MSDGGHDASEPALPARLADAEVETARCFNVLSPYDGSVVGRAPDIDFRTLAARFDEGVRAAGMLQSTRFVQERLRNWAGKIAVRREELARIISLETGKPIRFARVEVDTALAVLDSYCSFPSIPLDRDWTPAQTAFSILNWCDPVLSTVKEAATVLSSGRALAIKPSSRAPLASLALAALWNEGDNLDALLFVAPSVDPIGMVRATLMTSRVTEVRFQGDREVGTFISSACQEAVVPVTVTPSERLPVVLYDRADVDAQCDAVLNLVFLQPMLSCAERVSCLYLHNSLADSLMPMLLDKVSRLRGGDPFNDETEIGPVIDDVAVALIFEQVEDAVLDGAMLSCGPIVRNGRQIQPLVVDHVKPFMRVCVEEREGPLLPVIRFSHPSELPDTTCLTIDSLISAGTSERGDGSRPHRQSAH